MGEGAGQTIHDYSTNALPLTTRTGGTNANATWGTDPTFGNYIVGDGNTTDATGSDVGLPAGGGNICTILAVAATTCLSNQRIIHFGMGDGSNDGPSLGSVNGYLAMFNDAHGSALVGSIFIADGLEHVLMSTQQYGGLDLYVDGVHAGNFGDSDGWALSGTIYLAQEGSGSYWRGPIGSVMIYGGAYNQTDATSLYNDPYQSIRPASGQKTLTLSTNACQVKCGASVAITATLTGGTGALVASIVSGGGSIASASPVFTYTAPATGLGPTVLAITDTTDGLVSNVTIRYQRSYPALPSPAYLDPAGPLATLWQSLVYFDPITGFPENLVANNLPIATNGYNYINAGEDARVMPGDFLPDATPSTTFRWEANSKSRSYPFGGVASSTVRAGNNTNRTYISIGTYESIELAASTFVPMIGQSFQYMGLTGVNGHASPAMGLPGARPNNPLYPVDTGGNPVGQVTMGKTFLQYYATSDIPVSGRYYARFCLYNITDGILATDSGNQYFQANDGSGVSAANSISGGQTEPAGSLDNLIVGGDWGLVWRPRMVGILNSAIGENGIGDAVPEGLISVLDYLVGNPYASTTATAPTTGNPPTALACTANVPSSGQPVIFQGLSNYLPSTTLTSAPAGLTYVCPGDFQIGRRTNLGVEGMVTRPLGSAYPIATLAFHRASTVNFTTTSGTLQATQSGSTAAGNVYFFDLPDLNTWWLTVVATDTHGNVYTYPYLMAQKYAFPPHRAGILGNSIETQTGNLQSSLQGMIRTAQASGRACVVSSNAISGTQYTDWFSGGTAQACIGIDGSGVQLVGLTPLRDWILIRYQREYAVTGHKLDQLISQVDGNSAPVTEAQFAAFGAAYIAGTGVLGSYTPSINLINLPGMPCQLGGRPWSAGADNMASTLYDDYAAQAAAAASGGTMFWSGANAQGMSIEYILAVAGQHPDPSVAGCAGSGYFLDWLAYVTPPSVAGSIFQPSIFTGGAR